MSPKHSRYNNTPSSSQTQRKQDLKTSATSFSTEERYAELSEKAFKPQNSANNQKVSQGSNSPTPSEICVSFSPYQHLYSNENLDNEPKPSTSTTTYSKHDSTPPSTELQDKEEVETSLSIEEWRAELAKSIFGPRDTDNYQTSSKGPYSLAELRKRYALSPSQHPYPYQDLDDPTFPAFNKVGNIPRAFQRAQKRFDPDDIPLQYRSQSGQKIPPVFICNVDNAPLLLSQISLFTRFKVNLYWKGEQTYLQTFCIADYEAVAAYLSRIGVDLAQRQQQEDLTEKFVIKGLDNYTDLDFVAYALLEQGVMVKNVDMMTKRQRDGKNKPIGLVKIELNDAESVKQLSKVRYIGYIRVFVEREAKKTYLPRCTRCQEWTHTQSSCNRPVICAWCAGCHSTSDCTADKYGRRCTHCWSQSHPASFIGCPMVQKIIHYLRCLEENPSPLTPDHKEDLDSFPKKAHSSAPTLNQNSRKSNHDRAESPTSPPIPKYSLLREAKAVMRDFLEDIDIRNIVAEAKLKILTMANPTVELELLARTCEAINKVYE